MTAAADSYVDAINSSVNYGTNTSLSVGRLAKGTLRRSLLYFNLSALPANTWVQDAPLNLYQMAINGPTSY